MALTLYNTMTRKKEKFAPVDPGKVRMYVCGPTVYDSCHIGHARSAVVFDVICRYFAQTGYEVTYVRNITDVDDKIIERANRLGVTSNDIAEQFMAEFQEDMDSLLINRPHHEPRATEHIPHIIEVIRLLMEKGAAYQVDGDVYFSVEAFEAYGKLSGRKLEDMEAGARVGVDERKKSPFDFALWKSAKPGEPTWDSPFGPGRPGWHIECSAMSSNLLGKTFDIHGGGKDLIFPHHENEIAQSECAFGQTFANYWIHNGFVNIDHEKMSKSLGNFLLIRDVLKTRDPEAVRLFLLSNHYRSPIDYSVQAMDETATGLDRLYGLLDRLDKALQGGLSRDLDPGPLWERFSEAMDDDFNTAKGIGFLFDAVHTANRKLDEASDAPGAPDAAELKTMASDMARIGQTLGIFTRPAADYFASKQQAALEKADIDPERIERLIEERASARREKNWGRADEIRDELQAMNVVLEDRPDGTVWKISE